MIKIGRLNVGLLFSLNVARLVQLLGKSVDIIIISDKAREYYLNFVELEYDSAFFATKKSIMEHK